MFIFTLELSFLGSRVMAGNTWENWENTELLSLPRLVTEFLLLLLVDLDQGLILDLWCLKNSLLDLFLLLGLIASLYIDWSLSRSDC